MIDYITKPIFLSPFTCLYLFFGGCFLLLGSPQQITAIGSSYITPSSVAGHKVLKVFTLENSPLSTFSIPTFTFQDNAGTYWIAELSNTRILRYDSSTQIWTIYWDHTANPPEGLHYVSGAVLPFEINMIKQSPDGKVWFASNQALPIRKGRDTYISYYDGIKWGNFELKVDPQDHLAIGLFTGRDGKLWLWKADELTNYDGRKWSNTVSLTQMFNTGNKISLLKSDGSLSSDNKPFTQKNLEISAALQDREGYIWICTRKGIVRFDERKNEVISYPQLITDIVTPLYEDRSGRIWFSNIFDIGVYNKRKNSTSYYKLHNHIPWPQGSGATVMSIYQDNKGIFLFGLTNGLLSYNELTDKWEYFNLLDLDQENNSDFISVDHIMEDKTGNIWLTTSIGIVELEK